MTCSHCYEPLDALRSASANAETPTEGDIILCPKCGLLNTVENFGIRKTTEDEYMNLDKETKRDLDYAIRNIQAANRRRNRKLFRR